jgi:glutathione peroxidase
MSKFRYMWMLLLALLACRQPQAQIEDMTMENETTAQSLAGEPKSVYDFAFKTLLGEEITLNDFKGRKMLLVNVASECGFTPQYKELQELYDKYGDKVVVLGFPANDFGGQEPGSNQEIAAFCERNYGVKFPIFEKITVTGPNAHPLYQYLSSKSLNGVTDEKPTWNFCKYLIDEKGKVLKFFPSKVTPLSSEIISAINQ